ncbi:hypothetical protein BVG16_13180 [Paenibacillus selenitireducens]|uniref:Thymidylate kinase-like domain-containing protein n=1 Tax=Paenibacillus selenitireducens TaxID=1324314 RepID=A0A1T2XC55_9BACL|nr:hypothetical protein [Paenibacillus selenitireducens]OPA77408.1 hypothetical protein BVG16_13180 [Paenibacillus selenitireducens]
MHNNKIIIVDGMPGSGKSTTASFIAEQLSSLHINNKLFLETSSDNPLFINTPALHSLSSEKDSEEFSSRVISLYLNFVEEYKEKETVIIIESLIYQGIFSVALFKGMKVNQVIALAQRIIEILDVMNPMFIFYVQKDAEKNWRRICDIRGMEFAKICGLHTDVDFQKAAQGWTYTQSLFKGLLQSWKTPSMIIENVDYAWDDYYRDIRSFLKLDQSVK